MELQDRIIAYIENHHPIPYSKIVQVAGGKGFTELEVLQALDRIKNKVKQTVRRGEVWYDLIPAPIAPKIPTHHAWLRVNYPPMTADNDGSGIEADFSYLFLTPDEMKEYKATAKGLPTYMMKKYG